jgi:hypothetical protein
MTGSTLTAPPNQGSWTVVHDGGIDDPRWNTITWTAEEPGDSLIKVFVEGSDDEDCATATFSGKQEVTNGESIASFSGKRCLKLTVEFTRSSTAQDGGEINDSPILYDIAVNSNTPPAAAIAEIDDASIPLPVTMKITPQALNLARHGKWVKAHLRAKSNVVQEMEVVLDGSGSYDEDGDALSFDWTLIGPNGEVPVQDAETVNVLLPAGNYTATLVVNDGTVDSEPAEEPFILTNYTAADMPSGSYQLNGVPQSEVKKAGSNVIVSFDDDAVAQTVQPGNNVEMVLTGTGSAVDHIKVISK